MTKGLGWPGSRQPWLLKDQNIQDVNVETLQLSLEDSNERAWWLRTCCATTAKFNNKMDNQDLQNEGQNCWEQCGEKGYCPEFCGQDGYCCRKGKKQNGCDGKLGGIGERVCVGRLYLSQDLQNEAESCLDECGQNGHCPQFCGRDGYCCKKGTKGNGCDGNMGGKNKEVCVGRMYLNIETMNDGSPCMDECGQNGHCPTFCGRDGYCCKKGTKGNGCNGKMGEKKKSICVGQMYQTP